MNSGRRPEAFERRLEDFFCNILLLWVFERVYRFVFFQDDICILTITAKNRLLYFLAGNVPVESVKFPKLSVLILNYNQFESVPEMCDVSETISSICFCGNFTHLYVNMV